MLEAPPGIYRGIVKGIESGHCTARIEVREAPGGCLTIDYEAVSDAHGLQHIDHAWVAADALHVAFGEAPGVTVFAQTSPDVYDASGDRPMRILASFEAGELSWSWHWGDPGEVPVDAPAPAVA